jgi:hypothetical protein
MELEEQILALLAEQEILALQEKCSSMSNCPEWWNWRR